MMASGANQTFAAAVTGNPNRAVTWELPDANSGSITAAGVYTTPATIPYEGVAYRVLARSQADPMQTDSITVTVKSPVYLAPQTLALPTNGIYSFTATVTGQVSQAVTWSTSSGNVTGTGLYTAPATPGTYTVTVTSVSDPTKQSSATVIVGGGTVAGGSDRTLVGFFSFEEGVYTGTKDASGWGNDGTLVGGVTWGAGKIGKGLSFDGISGRVSVPTLNVFSGQFTISAWVKFNAVNRGVDNTILGHGSTTANQGLRCTERNGKAYFGFYANDLAGLTPLEANVWTHLVYVFDGAQKKIYVNGILDAVQNTAPYAGNATNLELGRIPWSSTNVLSGSLDEVRIYSRALTAGEVTSLYGSQANVTITPRNVTMASGANQTFAAAVTGNPNGAVTWELPDANSGSITAAGVYTAPATIPYEGVTYRVLARSQADLVQTDTITVTVKSPVYVAPKAVTILTNGSYGFAAVVTGQTNTSVTWSASGGTVSASGTYTAPGTPGTYTVTATSVGDMTKVGTATVTVLGAPVAPDLVATWSFEEGSGNRTIDVSGWSNDGTLLGGTTWGGGKVGKALSFDGTSGRISVPTLNTFSGQFTISAWVKFNSVNRGADNAILGHGSAGVTNKGLHCTERNGKAYFGFYANDLAGNTSLQANVWTHLVYSFDGTQKKIYVNGVLDAVQNSAPYTGSAANLELGRVPWNPTYILSGSLDEVRIHTRALTATEVTALYGSQPNVTISPRNVTMASGASQAFSAAVTGTANMAVTWELPDSDSGSITADGVYSAPSIIPFEGVNYHIIARSQADPTQTDTIAVTVKSAVYVSPETVSIPANGTYPFMATVTGQTNTNVTWSASGGMVSATGIYTAPGTPGTYTVTAASAADATKTGTATIIVGAAESNAFAYFPMDEGTGTQIADAAGNGALGTLVNGPAWVTGKFGSALNFSNSNAMATLNPVVGLGSNWTISAWFQYPFPNTGTWHTLTRGVGGDHQIQIHTDQVTLGCYDNTASVFRSSGFKINTLPAGWHQVAAVGESGTTQFYVDGQAVGSVIPWQSKTDIYAVGNYQGGGQAFGVVDDFRIYRRALGTSEVAGLYTSTVNVGISPSSALLPTGASQAFTATVTGNANTAVTWELPDPNSGSITDGGVYTAPTAIPYEGAIYRVVAHSQADLNRTASAPITVRSSVSVTPAVVVVPLGSSTTFTGLATVQGSSNTSVTWSASGGTIASAGIYTAPTAAGTYTVTAKAAADASKVGTATAIVPLTLSVSPGGVLLAPGGARTFTASFVGTTNTSVTWSATGGTIDGSGNYVAPLNPGIYLVVASSVFDPTRKASATVWVSPDGILDVSGTWADSYSQTFTLFQRGNAIWGTRAGTTIQATISGQVVTGVELDANGATVLNFRWTFSLNGNTYTGLWASGTATPTTSWTGTRAPGVVSIQVSPNALVLPMGGTQTFLATVAGTLNKSVTWTVTGGSVDSSGGFIAGSVPGLYSLTATALADTAKSARCTLMVTADGVMEISGRYTTTAYDLLLYQNGPQISGDWFTDNGGWAQHFFVRGTLDGNHVVLTYYNAASPNGAGTMDLTFAPDGLSFTGKHSYYGTWNGTRQAGVIAVRINPTSMVLQAGTSAAPFKVDVAGSYNHGYVYVFAGGAMAGDTFTAGSQFGAYSITATALADTTKSAKCTVMVTVDGVMEISGRYTTSAYDLLLFQSGIQISGDWFTDNGGWAQHFFVRGTLDGNHVVLTYYNAANPNGAGTMDLTFLPDGLSFTGKHSYYGTWNGTRQSLIIVQNSPTQAILSVGGNVQMGYRLAGAYNKQVVWSTSGGSIQADGFYVAPLTKGVQTVKATSVALPMGSATSTISVTPAGYLEVAGRYNTSAYDLLLKQNGTAVYGDWFTDNGGWAQHFYVKGTLDNFHLVLTYYNAANPNGAGTMDLTFAPDALTFTGKHSYYGTWNGTRLNVPVVQIRPGNVTLPWGGTQTFTTDVGGTPATSTQVTWSVLEGPAAGGTITTNGFYTAPSSTGVFHVVATSVQDLTAKDTVTVTVQSVSPLKVTIAPTQVSMDKMATQPFAAVVTGSADTVVMWSASDGQIDLAGNYTAPDRYGTFTVTASAPADSAVRDEATVVVPGGTPAGTFIYDPNGNLTDDGQRSFEWDAENRLVAVTIIATGHRSEFGYDGLGRRVEIIEKDPDATQTLQVTSDKKYLWDGVEIAEERDAIGGIVTRQFYNQGFVDTDGTILFYTRDHLGSIRELTDSTQAVRARYDYDPYGRMTKVQGDKDSLFGYTGILWHSASGLDLTKYRAYDPNLGRWISRDPYEEKGGINYYQYSSNDPVLLTDRLGLCPCLGSNFDECLKKAFDWVTRARNNLPQMSINDFTIDDLLPHELSGPNVRPSWGLVTFFEIKETVGLVMIGLEGFKNLMDAEAALDKWHIENDLATAEITETYERMLKQCKKNCP
jgi:RHS repeat-associated protein